MACHENGGIGAAPGHDAHMLYTVSGVQILATLDAFGDLEQRIPGGKEKIGKCKCLIVCANHAATHISEVG
jgi:prenyltransferase beta subunit